MQNQNEVVGVYGLNHPVGKESSKSSGFQLPSLLSFFDKNSALKSNRVRNNNM